MAATVGLASEFNAQKCAYTGIEGFDVVFKLYVPCGFLIFALLSGLAQQTSSTTPAETDERVQTPITVDVNRVNMLFTVSDKKGRFVTDLDKSDLEVIESKRPQQIIEFVTESDLPLRMAISE